MATLILVPRSVEGYASAAVLARHLRFDLFEEIDLDGRDLRFTDAGRVARHLEEAAGDLALVRVALAGIGEPADAGRTETALERLLYAGVELDWYEPRPWHDPRTAERLGRYARLHVARREWPNAPQFILSRLALHDPRAQDIVDISLPPAMHPIDHPNRPRLRRWHYLLSALTHDHHLPQAREALRRLAFNGARIGEADDPLIAEEWDRRRWLARDFRLQAPFPTVATGTRQTMAVADLRRETGAPLLKPGTAARALARVQPVRYTLVALSSPHGWRVWLHSWPADIGDLARVPGLAAASGEDFVPRFETSNRARFAPSHARASLFGLARALADRL